MSRLMNMIQQQNNLSNEVKDKKTKKQLVEDLYQNYLTRYFGESYKDKNLKIKKKIYKNYDWGVGAEHEMHLFHISKDRDIGKSSILFDSQESTCLLTHKIGSKENGSGACCKILKNMCYHEHPEVKKKLFNKYLIKDKDVNFLKSVPWELSGRQSSGCDTIMRRMPILMPEIITGSHKNRTMESISEELIFMEKKFIDLQMKNPYTKEKVKKYGEIRQLPFGAIETVKVPIKPTSHLKEYKYQPYSYIDYLGSYHVTLTLPHPKTMKNDKFIEIHQNFCNQFQWIEPLLITAFFTGDPKNIISKDKKIRGSYRIMSTGWGNLAGSDLRKLTKKRDVEKVFKKGDPRRKTKRYGIGRYATVPTYWREGLNFKESKKIMDCDRKVMILEPMETAIGMLSSDIRTFGFDYSKDCKEYSSECPKVSGYPMIKPNGVELRIFDHFNSRHFLDLLRIIVYIAENSRIKQCKKYVYQNDTWKKTLRGIMTNGWRSIITVNYIEELNKNLGLKLELKKKLAFELLLDLNEKIFEKNKDGLYSTLLLEKKYKEPPNIPQINRFNWQIRFNLDYSKKIKSFIKKHMLFKKEMTLLEFKKLFFTHFDKELYEKNLLDIIFAFESPPNNNFKIVLKEGVIKKITYIKKIN